MTDGGSRPDLVFQTAAMACFAFPVNVIQAVFTVAVFFFEYVTDMASPSFFRHKELTIEKTKKGQNREKKSLNSAPKNAIPRFKSLTYRQNPHLHLFSFTKKRFSKTRGKRRKNEKNRGKPRFFRMHLFWSHKLAYPTGFEPAASRVGVLRSIQLGYG